MSPGRKARPKQVLCCVTVCSMGSWRRGGAGVPGGQGLLNSDRGLGIKEEQRQMIEARTRAVEAGNPTKAPLRSPLMNGRWYAVPTCLHLLRLVTRELVGTRITVWGGRFGGVAQGASVHDQPVRVRSRAAPRVATEGARVSDSRRLQHEAGERVLLPAAAVHQVCQHRRC